MTDQLVNENQEATRKESENQALMFEVERLTKELKSEKEANEILKRNEEPLRMLDGHLRGQRKLRDITGLGLTENNTTDKGESSNQAAN